MTVSIDLPKTQRAIVANEQLNYCIRDDVPLPPTNKDCIIIKTERVGLNPVDTKIVGPFVGPGAVYDVDCAGIIAAMGADIVMSRRLKLGDQVAGGADGIEATRPQSGAFADFEVGASMRLRIATSAMALCHSLGIPPSLLETPAPEGESFDVGVHGGATATGTMAIQLLERCGVRVITTCSPRSFKLVREYGADEFFDYNSPSCGADIRDFTNNALDYALDCITEENTMKIRDEALGRCSGKSGIIAMLTLQCFAHTHYMHLLGVIGGQSRAILTTARFLDDQIIGEADSLSGALTAPILQ